MIHFFVSFIHIIAGLLLFCTATWIEATEGRTPTSFNAFWWGLFNTGYGIFLFARGQEQHQHKDVQHE